MASFPTNADPTTWQRYFAIEANNRAWDLSVKDRSSAEDREMLNLAHSAAWHWDAVGNELNCMRAVMLLAEVHALLRLPTTWDYAQSMLAYFTNRDTEDWELAFTHTIYAHAASVVGREKTYQEAHARAIEAIAVIASDTDRRIVQDSFNAIERHLKSSRS